MEGIFNRSLSKLGVVTLILPKTHGYGIIDWHMLASMTLIHKLVKHDLVNGLPKLKYKRDHICSACMKGRQISVSFKLTNEVFTSRPLILLHMDLFGPMTTLNLGEKQYVLVIIDDYSRFT